MNKDNETDKTQLISIHIKKSNKQYLQNLVQLTCHYFIVYNYIKALKLAIVIWSNSMVFVFVSACVPQVLLDHEPECNYCLSGNILHPALGLDLGFTYSFYVCTYGSDNSSYDTL